MFHQKTYFILNAESTHSRRKMTIWAFAKVTDQSARDLVYSSIKEGFSRFGWSSKDDPSTIIEFDRKDPNIHPAINLKPRQRYHRIYAESEFLDSIETIRNRPNPCKT